jgi:hypothetical protein
MIAPATSHPLAICSPGWCLPVKESLTCESGAWTTGSCCGQPFDISISPSNTPHRRISQKSLKYNMEDQWTEAQYEAALAQLEALTDKVPILFLLPLIANNTDDPTQLTALRTTIPSIISPLTRPSTTKPAAFAGLKKAAVGAVTGVQDLRKEWESDGVQDLLKRSKTSYDKNTDLGLAVEVPAWGWVKEGDKQEENQGQQSEVVKEEKVGG